VVFRRHVAENGRAPEEAQHAVSLTSEEVLRLVVMPDEQGRYHFDEMGNDNLPEYLGYLVGYPGGPLAPDRTGPGYQLSKADPEPGVPTAFGRDAAHVGNGVEASGQRPEVRSLVSGAHKSFMAITDAAIQPTKVASRKKRAISTALLMPPKKNRRRSTALARQ